MASIPIEKTILDYLSSALGVSCFIKIAPESPTFPYITIQKTGGGEDNHLFRATLAIQSHAESCYGASVLNEQVKEAMSNCVTLDRVTSSALNSDYDYTNTTTKHYRYQAVFDIHHY